MPVAFVFYNRPEYVRLSFRRIRELAPRRLLLIADGPKSEEDAIRCGEARSAALQIDWPCDVETSFSDSNLGCRARLTSGLTWAFERAEEMIIVEDDCIPDPSFFSFCASLLERYRDDERVTAISGNNFQGGRSRGSESYYFSRYCHIWGWATWRRAWSLYEANVESFPDALRTGQFSKMFDSEEESEFWRSVLDRCYRRELDTWDYQWMYSCWRRGGLCIHPAVNLVTNIGCDPELSKLPHGQLVNRVEARTLSGLVHPPMPVRNVEADRFTFENLFAPGGSRRRKSAPREAVRRVFGRLAALRRAS